MCVLVFPLQFPHRLVRGPRIVHTQFPQHLLEVHLSSYEEGENERERRRERDGRAATYRRLFGDVHKVLEGVILMVLECIEQQVVHLPLVIPSSLHILLLTVILCLREREGCTSTHLSVCLSLHHPCDEPLVCMC